MTDYECGSCGAFTDLAIAEPGDDYHEPDADCRSFITLRTPAENADRAVIARIGGNAYRREGGVCRARGYTRTQTDEHMAFETTWRVKDGNADRPPTMLPEAAFDWPIYRAATDHRRNNVILGMPEDWRPSDG